MISIVALAVGAYTVIIISHSSPTISNQNERIYLYGSSYPDDYKGYVKVSDMKPNSAGYFMYPSSYNYSKQENAYQRFVLIRLPSWLGGDKNDISAFRAYSQLDIASHCLVGYFPNRAQNIQDPCWFEQYRIVDGAASYQSVKVLVKPIYNALPQLDLVVDNEGYLSVKPPTWTADRNGVVGDGRILPADDIRQSSKILLEDYKNMSGINLNIPLQLQTGEFLLIISGRENNHEIDYQNLETWNGTASLNIEFCNCSKPFSFFSPAQLHQVSGIPMLVIDWNNPNNDYKAYMVIFVKNGYQISLSEQKPLQVITTEILHDFFNDMSNSTAQNRSVN